MRKHRRWPPDFGLSDDDARVFISSTSALDCVGAPGTLASLPNGKPFCFASADAPARIDVRAFRDGVIHGITETTVRSIDSHNGKLVRDRPLFPAGGSRIFSAEPSPSGRWLGIASEEAGISLLDLDTGSFALVNPTLPFVSDFAFAAAEHRWAAVRAQEGRTQGVVLFDGARTLGVIPGPLQAKNWLDFADGSPFDFSPDGSSALVLRPDGTLERWRVDGPVREAVLAPRFDGAQGVLWPTVDRSVIIGPRLLVFLEMREGAIISEHRFPE